MQLGKIIPDIKKNISFLKKIQEFFKKAIDGFEYNTLKSKALTDTRYAIAGIVAALTVIFLLFGFNYEGSYYSITSMTVNEIMTSNKSTLVDEDGDYSDWIEIKNTGSSAVNLEGYGLSDEKRDTFKWRFPPVIVKPGENIVVFASGKDRRGAECANLHTNFKLGSDGDLLLFSDRYGQIIEEINIPALASNVSYGKGEGADSWLYFERPTPGSDNTTLGHDGPVLGSSTVVKSQIFISEIMSSNKASCIDEDGECSDWIEIKNSGNTAVSLSGYGLSDNPADPFKWKFPNVIIEPEGYLLVFASGKDRAAASSQYLHTNFKLDSMGETLVLTNNAGQTIDMVEFGQIPANVSYGRKMEDRDVWLYFPASTPGIENKTHGFSSLPSMDLSSGANLVISEIMALNGSTIKDDDGDYSDWIEIYNPTNYTISLKDYWLSDEEGNPFKWRFPDINIEPFQYFLVFASGKDRVDLKKNILHTNFELSTRGETVLLSYSSGMPIHVLKGGKFYSDISYGLNTAEDWEPLYFQRATPGAPNSGPGLRGFAQEPRFSQMGGFFKDSQRIELSVNSPEAVIRYTLDGSTPSEKSPVYSSPILLNKTTVLRARAFEEGKMPSPTVTHTFFINENHTLTVISLSTNPSNLWDEEEGIYVEGPGASPEFPHVGANYWMDIEKPVHFELFEPDGKLGISLDAGIKIFGSYSRAMDQKSFSIIARDDYGYERINYPFFPDKPHITSFKSILLRTSGQDAVLTKIRDAMIARVVRDSNVDYEAYRPAVVYINGEYWGLYNIREKISPYYLAANHGVDPENVDILEANGRVNEGSNEDYKALIEYVKTHDMRIKENYEYVKERMDIDNFIDYEITQMYCANTDTGNIKFWRERVEGGKWRWILFDTDWGFYNVNHNTVWYLTNPKGTGIGLNFSTALIYNLLKNEEFKSKLVERCAYHINNTFKPERVIAIIDEMASAIEPEMERNLNRWGGKLSGWYNRIEGLRDFARKRPKILCTFLQKELGLSDEEMKIFHVEME